MVTSITICIIILKTIIILVYINKIVCFLEAISIPINRISFNTGCVFSLMIIIWHNRTNKCYEKNRQRSYAKQRSKLISKFQYYTYCNFGYHQKSSKNSYSGVRITPSKHTIAFCIKYDETIWFFIFNMCIQLTLRFSRFEMKQTKNLLELSIKLQHLQNRMMMWRSSLRRNRNGKNGFVRS